MSAAPMSPTARTAYRTPSVVHEQDWGKGLLMLLAAVLTIGWLDANDRAVDEDEAARHAAVAAERAALRQLDTMPHVRLEGAGYKCRAAKVRTEWIPAVMDSCKKLGELLRTARATE